LVRNDIPGCFIEIWGWLMQRAALKNRSAEKKHNSPSMQTRFFEISMHWDSCKLPATLIHCHLGDDLCTKRMKEEKYH